MKTFNKILLLLLTVAPFTSKAQNEFFPLKEMTPQLFTKQFIPQGGIIEAIVKQSKTRHDEAKALKQIPTTDTIVNLSYLSRKAAQNTQISEYVALFHSSDNKLFAIGFKKGRKGFKITKKMEFNSAISSAKFSRVEAQKWIFTTNTKTVEFQNQYFDLVDFNPNYFQFIHSFAQNAVPENIVINNKRKFAYSEKNVWFNNFVLKAINHARKRHERTTTIPVTAIKELKIGLSFIGEYQNYELALIQLQTKQDSIFGEQNINLLASFYPNGKVRDAMIVSTHNSNKAKEYQPIDKNNFKINYLEFKNEKWYLLKEAGFKIKNGFFRRNNQSSLVNPKEYKYEF